MVLWLSYFLEVHIEILMDEIIPHRGFALKRCSEGGTGRDGGETDGPCVEH